MTGEFEVQWISSRVNKGLYYGFLLLQEFVE